MAGKLVVQIGAVGDNQNSRAVEQFAFHQHTSQKQHSIALPAAGSAEIGAALSVTVRTHMQLDILKQFCCSKELRITANDFQLFIRAVGEIDKILDNRKQTVFSEQPLHHRDKRVDSVQLLVLRFNFPPRIEIVVGTEKRTVFIVCPVADDHKGVVFEQFRNISAVADGELLVSVHDRCIFFDGTLEFQNHHGNAIDKHNAIGNAELSAHALDFKLIDRFEDVVFGIVIVDELNI